MLSVVRVVKLLSVANLVAAHLPRRQDQQIAVVNLANKTGAPEHLASGLLYGVPLAQDQIPDHFFEEFGLTYQRGGGTHIGDGGGWISGLPSYQVRCYQCHFA